MVILLSNGTQSAKRMAHSVYSLIIYQVIYAGSSPSTLAVCDNGDTELPVGGTLWCGPFCGHCDAPLPGDGVASRGKQYP